MNSQTKKPTLASTWQAVAGSPLTDQFVEWPPIVRGDKRHPRTLGGIYRFALSPTSGLQWPPRRIPNWSEAVEVAGQK